MTGLARRTLVVAVLHRSRWEDLALEPALAPLIGACALLFDNGGAEMPDFAPPWRRMRDGRNPGVGPRYLEAARVAKECGLEFLLLLDQDFSPPEGWWPRYEDAVAQAPQAQAWAPRLECGGIPLSPFRLRSGRPAGPAPEGLLASGRHVALNSGLLVRTDSVLQAAAALEACPLDFSDFALSWSLGRTGSRIAPVALTLEHSSSTHARTDNASRRRRFAWFCRGARGWAGLSGHRISIATWVAGRAFKLALAERDPAFLRLALRHFLRGTPP